MVISIDYIYLMTPNSFTFPQGGCIFHSNSLILPVLAVFHQLEVNESAAGMGSIVFGEQQRICLPLYSDALYSAIVLFSLLVLISLYIKQTSIRLLR